jgi:CheY-like chemotaxis protein
MAASSRGGASVLVVDDYPGDLVAIEATLAPLGVLLLDVRMPTMDGLATAAALRGFERSSVTPILFITAVDEQALLARAARYTEANETIWIKPIDPNALCNRVQTLVDRWVA